MTDNLMLQASMQLAANGRFIIPVTKDKRPTIKNWPNNGTTDTDRLKVWFEHQNHNIGIVSGHKSGFFCLDVDGEVGKASLLQLEKQYGVIPIETACMADTPSNGVHYFFIMRKNLNLRNSAGKLGNGIDIRANGGYVVVSPSKIINKNGIEACYKWSNLNLTLAKGQLPDAPEWLLNLLIDEPKSMAKKVQVKPNDTIGYTTAYGRKALDTECSKISHAVEGTRNDTLNKSAFNVFRLVAGGEVIVEDAENELRLAAYSSGLETKEIIQTIASAKSKGLQSPKTATTISKYGIQDKSGGLPKPPLEAFPSKIQQMLKQAAIAFKQLPIEIPVVAFLAFLAGCINRGYVAVVKDGWEEGGNLYLGIIANSGTGKSPCFKEFMRPIWKQELKHKLTWDKAMGVYNLQMEERRKIKDLDKLGSIPEKPLRKQYIVEDITLEALGEVLAENPRGVLWNSDELSSIMLNFDRYSNNKGGTESRLLSAYDGAPWKITRRDRDKDHIIPSATLSIVGTVQPKVIGKLFDAGDAASGFLPRFIFIKAVQERPPHINDVVFIGQEILDKIAERLLNTLMLETEGGPQPHRIALSAEAGAYYFEWHNEQLMDVAWAESQTARTIAPKIAAQVIRIALLLHLLDKALNEEYSHSEISLPTLQRAIMLGDWIMTHQKLVWLALDIEDERLKTPLDRAIVTVSLSLETYLITNDWRVANEDFNSLVCKKINDSLDSSVIGRAAAKLGIKNIHVKRKRYKVFSEELLKQFKLDYYL